MPPTLSYSLQIKYDLATQFGSISSNCSTKGNDIAILGIKKLAFFSSVKGEDVLERSSELIHSGDVVKTSNGSSQDRVMFLFDHQLVYCKKVRKPQHNDLLRIETQRNEKINEVGTTVVTLVKIVMEHTL